jgi:hypothetical protein
MLECVDDRKRHSSEGKKINIIYEPPSSRDRVPSNINYFYYSGAKFLCKITFILICVRTSASCTVDEFN